MLYRFKGLNISRRKFRELVFRELKGLVLSWSHSPDNTLRLDISKKDLYKFEGAVDILNLRGRFTLVDASPLLIVLPESWTLNKKGGS